MITKRYLKVRYLDEENSKEKPYSIHIKIDEIKEDI
jgi:hypothetical protein